MSFNDFNYFFHLDFILYLDSDFLMTLWVG